MTRLTTDTSLDMVYAPREDGNINFKSMDLYDKGISIWRMIKSILLVSGGVIFGVLLRLYNRIMS